MDFEILSDITDIETIAAGVGVRDRNRLRKQYGRGRRRKLKGIASVRLISGKIGLAEVHWYEAMASAGRNSNSNYRFWIS